MKDTMSQESKEMDQVEMVMIKHEVIPLHTISTSITLNSQYAMYNPCVHPILCLTPRTVEPLKNLKEAEPQVNSDEYQNKVEPLSEPITVQPSIQYDPKCRNPDEFECVMDKPSIPEVSLPCSSLDTSFDCNMMHCKSESCYSSHCNVKSGDLNLKTMTMILTMMGFTTILSMMTTMIKSVLLKNPISVSSPPIWKQ